MRSLPWFLLVLIAGSSVVRSARATPRNFTVHTDHLDPAKVERFVGARREWLGAIQKRRLSDHRGFFVQAGAATFLTLHSFESFADLDPLKRARRETVEAMGDAAWDAYSRGDEALVAPHASEIWVHEEAFDYAAPGAPSSIEAAPYARMVVELIRPTPERGEAQYEATWREVREALRQARYPLARVSYFSAYGSGKYITFWLASTQAALAAAPSMEDALVAALGSAKARELLCRLAECVIDTERFDVVRRTDLDSPP